MSTRRKITTLFFFYWCAAHRDLHSFPTRRSSDLPGSGRGRVRLLGWPVPAVHELHRVHGQQQPHQPRRCELLVPRRSEEHTSELQSHVNLVCRLLLEKKKIDHQTVEHLAKQLTDH